MREQKQEDEAEKHSLELITGHSTDDQFELEIETRLREFETILTSQTRRYTQGDVENTTIFLVALKNFLIKYNSKEDMKPMDHVASKDQIEDVQRLKLYIVRFKQNPSDYIKAINQYMAPRLHRLHGYGLHNKKLNPWDR